MLIGLPYKLVFNETFKALTKKYIPCFNAAEEYCIKMKIYFNVTDEESIIKGFDRTLVLCDGYTTLFYLQDRGDIPEELPKSLLIS